MKKQKWLILATAAGLLSATGASAAGLVEKVNGILHNEIAVTIDGSKTALHPVYIDGKAYLPARDTATALGYDLTWNNKQMELQHKGAGTGAADYLSTSGVIVNATQESDSVRLEVLGHGPDNWIILHADKDTVLTGADGKALAVKDLKAGMHITAQYGPVIAMSYPGQSHAASLQVTAERLIKEQAIYSVDKTDDGWQIQFSELKNGIDTPTLTINAGKETMLVTPEGQTVEWSQLKPGSMVRAYYGPVIIDPHNAAADVIVVLKEQLDTASVKAYRDLAWTLVPESQKSHLLTKKDEAQVDIIDAKGAAVMAADDKQKQVLADLQAKDGKLISVNYSTDQDALLGPLMIVINPETKELVGFFIRR